MSTLARFQDWLLRQGLRAENKKAGLTEHAVALSCGQLSYLAGAGTGRADTVLMLHGAAADSSSWVRLAGALKGAWPLLIPDLPGHGRSSADGALGYGIAAQTERIAELLARLGLQRVHVMGNSMGGAIALRLAARHPALVASLTLIGTMGVQAHESWLQQHIRETGNNPMLSIRNGDDYRAMLHIGMQRPPYMPGFVLASLARQYMARLAINNKIGEDILGDLDQRAELDKIVCPALIVWGRQDRVAHVANAQPLQLALAGSEVQILDGVGHIPMVEAPQALANLCQRFLSAAAQPGVSSAKRTRTQV